MEGPTRSYKRRKLFRLTTDSPAMSELNVSVANVYDLGWHYASIEGVQALEAKVDGNSRDMDVAWLVICGEYVPRAEWLRAESPRDMEPRWHAGEDRLTDSLVVWFQARWSSTCRRDLLCSRLASCSPRTLPTSCSRT